MACSYLPSAILCLGGTYLGWRSELGRRPGQQLPIRALLLPVHQDMQVLGSFLAVGKFLLADEVEADDGGRTDDTNGRILVFERRPFVVCLGDAGLERCL